MRSTVFKYLLRKLNISKYIYHVAKLIGKVNYNSIRIDGGFGSQIIGYMQFIAERKINPNFDCDVSFFEIPPTHPMFLKDVTFRVWKLDYFNIQISELSKISSKKYWFLPNLEDQGIRLQLFLKLQYSNFNWDAIFPIKDDTYLELKKIGVNSNESYTAIHIRKGDFLKFSSLNISDDNLLQFLGTIRSFIKGKIFIVSDDNFDDNYKTSICSVLNNWDIVYISGGDEITIHSLLRSSDLLITANSMFSLTAALLQKKGGLSILPKQFFGDDFIFHNKAINELSQWVILSCK